ncbi:unnamed protein product [Caenorhabditis auriculariae]|uniref:MATH domain-containing protein n=1 Tax=Caenorhabditis auriculariae TaxID=2777116 RepID=A0A8S1GQU5_9PELO|nr:unnamed protein product [Caenorhabditis auriculariae]
MCRHRVARQFKRPPLRQDSERLVEGADALWCLGEGDGKKEDEKWREGVARNPSASGSSCLSRPGSLRSDDSNSPQPRKLEVVSKQATKVTALSTKLEWKIEQFEKLMKLVKNGHNLVSHQFGVPQAPTVCWELHVYPNGKREEDQNNVSFFLRQVGLQVRGEEPIMTEFQIYALDGSSQRVSVCRDTKDFTNQQGRGKFQVSREK